MIFDERTPWYKRLKLLRTDKELSQVELSELIGVPTKTYQRWEYGDNLPIAIYRSQIAKVLEVEETTIFSGELKRRSQFYPTKRELRGDTV